ncbi:MAG: hypothetical protein H6755_02525 [Candidatus Omnitrophica bacterium]|nr:hypothetical protein [Candidatus Omnitrophota bacterium]
MKLFMLILAAAMIVGTSSFSEAKKTPQMSTEEIINNAQTLQSSEEKIEYLLIKGDELLETKQYQEAFDVAQYVLTELDPTSEKAISILTSAQEHLDTDGVLESQS